MGRVLDVNWAGLKHEADMFKEQSDEIYKLTKEINDAFNGISECWEGIPAENFITNSKNVINNLVKEKVFLDIWYEFLTKTSSIYSENYEEALLRIKNVESEFDLEELEL